MRATNPATPPSRRRPPKRSGIPDHGASESSFFFKIQKGQREGDRHPDLYNVLIALKHFRLRGSANGSVYRLCDIERILPETIDCNGIARPVKMVLKLYCRVPERELKKQREERRYQALLRGKMMLSHD